MDLFSEKVLEKLDKEEEKVAQFSEKDQTLEVMSTADRSTPYEKLLNIKFLFQKMLPKMPREYILRQVFDQKHCSLVLNGGADEGGFIGAVCYRPAFDRQLVEVVFFAVNSEYHINGYGTFMFNCLKEMCKLQYKLYRENGPEYIRKNIIIKDLNIFDRKPTEEESILFRKFEPSSMNVAIDYEPPDINGGPKNEQTPLSFQSIEPTPLTAEGNEEFGLESHVEDNKSPVGRHGPDGLHQSKKQKTNNQNLYLLTYADNSAIGFFKKQGFTTRPVSTQWAHYIKDYDGGTLMECKLHYEINYLKKKALVSSVRERIFEEMKKHNEYHIVRDSKDRGHLYSIYQRLTLQNSNTGRTKEEFLADFIHFLICSLQENPSAWPFLEPVNIKDVPDYAEVIKRPIDLGTIYKKYKAGEYKELREFTEDIMLMVNNCFTYNGVETQYYKCGEIIQTSYEQLLSKYTDVIKAWGYDN